MTRDTIITDTRKNDLGNVDVAIITKLHRVPVERVKTCDCRECWFGMIVVKTLKLNCYFYRGIMQLGLGYSKVNNIAIRMDNCEGESKHLQGLDTILMLGKFSWMRLLTKNKWKARSQVKLSVNLATHCSLALPPQVGLVTSARLAIPSTAL